MSGIDFKSFLIGILITVIFVFTTGISLSGGGKYMTSCGQSECLVLNTETGAGRHVHKDNDGPYWKFRRVNGENISVNDPKDSISGRSGYMKQGTKPNF